MRYLSGTLDPRVNEMMSAAQARRDEREATMGSLRVRPALSSWEVEITLSLIDGPRAPLWVEPSFSGR
jgi:hypothetical protein